MVGFGGALVRARDPRALVAWYERHLGLTSQHGAFVFEAQEQRGPVALAFFAPEDEYFPAPQPVMLNLQVDDLDALLDRLAADGVAVDPSRDEGGYGRFGWCVDPEGNRVELWQPAREP